MRVAKALAVVGRIGLQGNTIITQKEASGKFAEREGEKKGRGTSTKSQVEGRSGNQRSFSSYNKKNKKRLHGGRLYR